MDTGKPDDRVRTPSLRRPDHSIPFALALGGVALPGRFRLVVVLMDTGVLGVGLWQQLVLWTACVVLPVTIGVMFLAAPRATSDARARAVRTGLAAGAGIAAWMF